MSLPTGVSNRPPMNAPHPAVLVRVLRVMAVMAFLIAPFLIATALQVKGLSWRYDRSRLTEQLARERQHRRHLVAEHARLTAPDRLREQATRLGLVPSRLGDGSTVLVSEGERGKEDR
jgi:hypothetical protein